ncbi:MAG TPA: hypothetical protein VGK24_16915 [Candidatus Angelobacter sp.]
MSAHAGPDPIDLHKSRLTVSHLSLLALSAILAISPVTEVYVSIESAPI